jgi:4-amino-4-deoxy-L-arabinose transferase-like glycosyltransferase
VLAAFWCLLLASVWDKSMTNDESGHVTAGYTYWRFHDYRLDPENGNLPQRLLALPLLQGFSFPPTTSPAWRTAEQWDLADEWFHHLGNRVEDMLHRSRAVAALIAVALGALVWWWARRLFGAGGGMLALLLYVLNPTILANGALTTSDTTAAFFFLAATLGIWAVLHRISLTRLALSGLTVGGLFATKISAALIIPVALVLTAVRLGRGQPLPVEFAARRKTIEGRGRQTLWFGAAALVHALLAWAVVWALYDFRYTALAPENADQGRLHFSWEFLLNKPPPDELLSQLHLDGNQERRIAQLRATQAGVLQQWSVESKDALATIKRTMLTPAQAEQFDQLAAAPPMGFTPRAIEVFRRYRLLPEAYLYGYAHAWKFMQGRTAFLNGETSLRGWKSFFPYTFLVKTPLPVFALAAIALVAALARRKQARRPEETVAIRTDGNGFYDLVAPTTLFLVYWAAVIPGHLNIGHRHILPIYPPLFILLGVAVCRVDAFGRWIARWQPFAVGLAVLLLAAETVYRFPNYLAYFNVLAGGPAQGFRHLVDSSLDWGQDLPALKQYLDRHPPEGPVYLSYFGNASPAYYRIPARFIRSDPGLFQKDHGAFEVRLVPSSQGAAAIAALTGQLPDYEQVGTAASGANTAVFLLKKPAGLRLTGGTYFISASMLQPIHEPWGPWNQRYEAIYQELRQIVQPLLDDNRSVRLGALPAHRPEEWQEHLSLYEKYRFARLASWLRQREPDGNINFSILIYRLTDADVAAALEGPPPELGPDMPRLASPSAQ